MTDDALKPGRYRHFKGKDYQVFDVVTHSETLERLVLYKPLYDEQDLWVRPRAMFTEEVQTEDGPVPRFRYVGPE